MNKHLRTAVCCFSLLGAMAFGADGVKMNGNVEAGYAASWAKNTTALSGNVNNVKDSQWLVDKLTLDMNYKPSDKTKVVTQTAIAANSGRASTLGGGYNSQSYFSRYSLNSTATGAGLGMAVNLAYLEHQCGDHIRSQYGLLDMPLGMESQWDRYDMSTYYYSTAYGVARGLGWTYDLGMKHVFDYFGNLEVAITEGRHNQGSFSPTGSLRWSYNWKSGDMSLTPVLSVLAGSWRSSPGELAFTGGTGFTMKDFFINAEFFYTKLDTVRGTDTSVKTYSIWFEPGYSFGATKISAKLDLYNTKVLTAAAQSDMDISAAVSHEYSDKMRVRLAYTHQHMSAKLGDHGNDIRVLFGTKW